MIASDDDAGFTLAEMLVALALLSLTFTALAAALSFSIRVHNISAKTDFQQNAVAANKFLRDAITRSQALYVQSASRRERKLQFRGGQSSIRFVSNLPGWTTVAGVHVIDIGLLPSPQQARGGELIAKFAAYRPMQAGEPKFYQPSTLLRNIQRIEFTYFGAKAKDQKAKWHTEWIDANRLPQLVAISVAFEDSRESVWPVTVIALSASQAPGT